jgi:hypothetical protein
MELPYQKLKLQLDKVWEELHTDIASETNEQRIRHVYTMLKILVLVLRAMVETWATNDRQADIVKRAEDWLNRGGRP